MPTGAANSNTQLHNVTQSTREMAQTLFQREKDTLSASDQILWQRIHTDGVNNSYRPAQGCPQFLDDLSIRVNNPIRAVALGGLCLTVIGAVLYSQNDPYDDYRAKHEGHSHAFNPSSGDEDLSMDRIAAAGVGLLAIGGISLLGVSYYSLLQMCVGNFSEDMRTELANYREYKTPMNDVRRMITLLERKRDITKTITYENGVATVSAQMTPDQLRERENMRVTTSTPHELNRDVGDWSLDVGDDG